MLERHKEGDVSFLEGGSGEPFVLLHGIPGSAFSWEAVGRRLSERYRVIIPDLLGFGRSDLPEGDYYMEAQAAAIRQLISSLGVERLQLAGHDFGGPVALTLMRMFSELHVTRLVLSATNTFTDTYIPPPLRLARLPLLGTLLFKLMVGNRLSLRVMYLTATKQKQEASWAKFQRHLTPSAVDFTQRIFHRSLANLKTNYEAIEQMLPGISAPTLILWGANDPFFPTSVGERIRRRIPGSGLRIYANTGHFVPEERPDIVAQDLLRTDSLRALTS